MAKSSGERFSDVLFYGLVFLLVYLVFRIFQPFLVPLGWAVVLAVIFNSAKKDIERRFGRLFAAAFSTTGVAVILIGPVLLLAVLFVREGINATHSLQASISAGQFGWFNRAWDWFVVHVAEYSSIDLSNLPRQGAARAEQYLVSEFGTILQNIVRFLLELFVTLFALFYCFRDGEGMVGRLRQLLPFADSTQERMLAEARELIFASVTTSLIIAAVQGLVCGGAFAIVGVGSPVFWGMVMAFLSLLPVVGAWPIWIPASIWLFSTGNSGRALLLIAICGGLGSTIDNILRPVLLGGRSSLNGLLVFISVLGGIAVFGILGIVLGPIVVATAVGILDVYSSSQAEREVAGPAQ